MAKSKDIITSLYKDCEIIASNCGYTILKQGVVLHEMVTTTESKGPINLADPDTNTQRAKLWLQKESEKP